MQALRARYREYIAAAADARPASTVRTNAPTRCWRWKRRSRKSQATREASANDHNADNRLDARRLRAPGAGHGLVRLLRRGGLARQETFVAWQPTAVTGVGGAGRVAAAGGLEGLPALPRHRRFRRRAAARLRRARRWRCAAPRPASPQRSRAAARARRDAIGHERRAREDVRRALFPGRAEGARVRIIVDNVRAALTQRVEAATWMSPATKASALAKLKTLYVGIGYPDRWQDYSALTVDPRTPLGNLRRVADRDYRQCRGPARPARGPDGMVDRAADGRRAARVPAERVRLLGRVAAAAQVRPDAHPTPRTTAPSARIIGHDVTHYVDVLGADYDADSRMRHWWTAEDMQRFQAAARAAGGSVLRLPAASRTCDQRQADPHREHRRPRRPRRRVRRLPQDARQQGRPTRTTCGSRTGSSSSPSREAGAARSARARCARRWPPTTTRRRATASPRFAISMHGTTRSTCGPGQRLYLEPAARVRVW